jgi:short-subunit dehydrogenase
MVFAGRGWRVGLIARGKAGLAEAAADTRALGAITATAEADVALSAKLREAAQRIVDEIGPPNVWINCAGNGVYGRFGVVPEDEFERVTAVTYGGTVNGCRVALDLMRPRGEGTIVNICSATAFHGLPLMTSYAGAKAAVRGFSQALRAELRIERSRIRVSTVFPPAVNTPFFAHASSHMGWPAQPAPMVYQPEIVAAGIHLAATRGTPEMVVSGTAAAFALASRLSPGLIAFLMSRLGFDKQQARDCEAKWPEASTLFAPLSCASPIHGEFGHRAKRHSVQLWASCHRWKLLAAAMLAGIAGCAIG